MVLYLVRIVKNNNKVQKHNASETSLQSQERSVQSLVDYNPTKSSRLVNLMLLTKVGVLLQSVSRSYCAAADRHRLKAKQVDTLLRELAS